MLKKASAGRDRMSWAGERIGGYMPQLDSLRWFAVLGVLVTHLWRPRGLPWILDDLMLEWAALGVRLFFVLSGFLITGILLDCRQAATANQLPRAAVIRQFYIRRVLRIFPIYYLVVVCGVVGDLPEAHDVWPWLVTYTTNVHITMFQEWPGPFGPFWSLAVEEQFYLAWPWLVLFAPRKWLAPAALTGLVLAPAYRAWAFHAFPFDIGAMDFKAATLIPASLDTLGAGALLAMAWRSATHRDVLQRWLTLGMPVGLILYIGALVLYHYRIHPVVFFTVADSASALMFAWLVGAAAIGFRGAIGRVLELPAIVYLGRISYGIYVYHSFSPWVMAPLLAAFGVVHSRPTFATFLLSSALSVLAAMVSWHAIESPINRLKRRFSYVPSDAAPVYRARPVASSV